MRTKGAKMQTDVLAVLRRQNTPMSAYEVLGQLRHDNPRLAPPTIYRALGALTESGRVHRLESLNAFVACQRDSHDQAAILSVCESCGSVEESLSSELLRALSGIAARSGFAPDRHVIEMHGNCAACRSAKDGPLSPTG